MPVYGAIRIANATPLPESRNGTAGGMGLAADAMHTHPRLTSATSHTLDGSGEATIVFTRAFTAMPCMDFTYIEATDNPPVVFKVKSWTMSGSDYIGCVAKGYRGQVLPSSILTLLALVSYNVFGASASGVSFTAIALQPS